MTGLALNYVYRSQAIDRMVLGASRPEELTKTLVWLNDENLTQAADAMLARIFRP